MFKWVDKLKTRQIRIILGVVMMYSFMSLAMSLYFLTRVAVRIDNSFIYGFVLVIAQYPNFWLPSVGLIVLTYLLLTKVWKYEGDRYSILKE